MLDELSSLHNRFSELALDEVPPGSSLADDLQEIYTVGLRAKESINQILSFARQSEMAIAPTQVGPIVRKVLKLIRSLIPSSISINSEIKSDSMIMGNQTQIHQILLNLCTKAAQAMKKTGGILSAQV